MVREAHKTSWETFISRTEEDVHGRQEVAYKVMKYLNKEERDTVQLNIITIDELIQRYQKLVQL